MFHAPLDDYIREIYMIRIETVSKSFEMERLKFNQSHLFRDFVLLGFIF